MKKVDQPAETKTIKYKLSFKEALERLQISEYSKRIWNSSSTGELLHIPDYIGLAETLKDEHIPDFKKWFEKTVELAEKKWERPESVFQHILELIVMTA